MVERSAHAGRWHSQPPTMPSGGPEFQVLGTRASKILAVRATLQPHAKAKQLCATSATPFELRYSQNQVEKVRT